MKTFLYGIALIFSVLFCLSSCSNSPIIGSWKVSDIKSDLKIEPSAVESYNETINEIKQTAIFTFNADSTYEQTVNHVNKKGWWKLLADDSMLKITLEDGTSININIESLSSSEMVQKVVSVSDGGVTVTQITTLVKQN